MSGFRLVRNYKFATLASLVLVASLAAPSRTQAVQQASTENKKKEAVDAQLLLQKWHESGEFPKGLVVRISACLGEPKKPTDGSPTVNLFKETWEFTTGEVRRVSTQDTDAANAEDDGDAKSGRRIEKRSFDTKGICEALIKGKATEIQARKGVGDEVGFVESDFERGVRSIEVEWNGTEIISLSEIDGPYLHLYRESDARAFGKLYEQLAGQARKAFNAKQKEIK